VAAVTDGFLVGSAEIALEGETGLRGTLRGEAPPATGGARRVVAELKSATYHDLALNHEGDAWRARVVIDV
jgi:SHS2 domain-containing protein